jgi:hypothetical protein
MPISEVSKRTAGPDKRRFAVKRTTLTYAGIGAAGVLLAGLFINSSVGQGDTTVANLAEKTHVHGIAVDPKTPPGCCWRPIMASTSYRRTGQ